MSSLDDLLSELDKPVTRSKTPAAAPAVDDLDALMAGLTAPVGAKPTPAAAPAKAPVHVKPQAVDDLDSLLNDLGATTTTKPAPAKFVASAPAPAPAKVASTPSAKPAPVDDLDSLLNDLGAPAPKPVVKPATAKVASVPAPAPAKPVAAKKVAAPIDDLDALMADLGTTTTVKSASPAARGPASPVVVKKVAAPVDDLDALMADLGSPAPAKKVASPLVTKKVAAAAPVDDLDALMADLGSPAPAKTITPPAAASPSVKRAGAVPGPAAPVKKNDDLDALMADLSVGATPARPTFQVQNGTGAARSAAPAPASNRTDELDSLMESLGGPPAKGTVVHSGGGAAHNQKGNNDLDDLMSSLSSPSISSPSLQARSGVTGSNAASVPTAVHSSNGSGGFSHGGAAPGAGAGRERGLSRFDDLMSTVTADMSDLNTHGGRSRGTCYHCRQPIYDECMQALGRTYHPEHFMCGSCNNPLGTGSFFELAGQAHCQRCYQLQFCPKCAHCNQAITDRCVTALDKKWHTHCFVCTQCTSPFQGNFFERDGRPYCDKCFHQVFAPRCRSCNQPVLGDCVNALGAQWHPEHFNCQYCRRAFTGTFFEYEGMPYCEAHYYEKMGSSCAGCQQAISGACVDALGKKWHPEHFVCAFCMNKLEGSSYSEKNSKAYCRPCFGKLFGS